MDKASATRLPRFERRLCRRNRFWGRAWEGTVEVPFDDVMVADLVALRLDDVGAASKQHEVYGLTRIRVGPLALPFPGNFLFLKYLWPIKRWAPYPELTAGQWDEILRTLSDAGATLTVGVTAAWVERDGRIVPFPIKFPGPARVLREGAVSGLLEIANHGYTHCVVDNGRFRPRLFSGNRPWHREFYDWLPEEVHRDHLRAAQEILASWIGAPVQTLVPPGNVLSAKAVALAASVGIRFISRTGVMPDGARDGVTFVDDSRVVAFHDRDIVTRGVAYLRRLIDSHRGARFVTLSELGRLQAATR
jgi:peptidoglycan/xylan/chitin deacetylase (PgdA/CDA1 family)